jgi:GNAT superfamily N-acetyltransferase
MRTPRLEIRSAAVADGVGVRRFLEGLSSDSRWNRYHAAVPRVRSWMVDSVVRADHVCHESLVALYDGQIVGIAEWGRLDGDEPTGDIAIVVREDCRRHGIARALLRRLARNARANGIDEFTGTILSMNRATIAFVQQVAPVRTIMPDGATLEVRVPLRATA